MDVRAFLKDRLRFIRQLHAISTQPYLEMQRKIEVGEDPFAALDSDDDSEPPYLNEWLEAEESIQVLRLACISMLASSLHVYFQTWEKLLRIPPDKAQFKSGWFKGYCDYFAHYSRVPFDKCPVDLALLEELVLVRNRVQHPESIALDGSYYSYSDLKKMKHPFFVDPDELERIGSLGDKDLEWLSAPAIRISSEKLELSMATVEAFCDWLESVEVPVDV